MKEFKEESLTARDGSLFSFNRKNWYSLANGQILVSCPIKSQINPTELANELKNWQQLSSDTLGRKLRRLNGFFAIILLSEQRTVIAADKIRSIPLFYSFNNNEFRVSDDANSLQELNATAEPDTAADFDPVCATEIASGLYLNGARTLDRNICQVQAGEWVELNSSPTRKSVSAHDYFRLSYQFDGANNNDCFNAGLTKVANQVVDNLLAIACDRQIVLPLSGGYDSRLLAMKLVERGAKNLLAYSYGESAQSPEVSYARQVAKSLSINWIFIPDTQKDWEVAWPTDRRKKYGITAANLCSFPHFQDWLAVKNLNEMGKLDKDAIFCPGHTGDFVSGSKIPQNIISHSGKLTYKSRFSDCADEALGQLAHVIANRDFARCNIKQHRSEIETRIRENLGCDVSRTQEVDAEFLVQQLYEWVWRQRQAKYIVNSVRVYEDHGFDWWLPLWDHTFLEFWTHVPLPQLLGQSAYISYIKNAYAEIVETNSEYQIDRTEFKAMDNAARNLWIRSTILRRIRATVPYRVQELAARLKKYLKRVRYSNTVIPIPNQPYTQVSLLPMKENTGNHHAKKSVLSPCPPVDALGKLAHEFVSELIDDGQSFSQLHPKSIKQTIAPLPEDQIYQYKNVSSPLRFSDAKLQYNKDRCFNNPGKLG